MSRRRIGAYNVISKRRSISQVLARLHSDVKQCKAALDISHADTCGVNGVARILEYTGQVAEASGFTNSLEPLQDIPIVNAALAFDNPIPILEIHIS
jgi:hypothetical protein